MYINRIIAQAAINTDDGTVDATLGGASWMYRVGRDNEDALGRTLVHGTGTTAAWLLRRRFAKNYFDSCINNVLA